LNINLSSSINQQLKVGYASQGGNGGSYRFDGNLDEFSTWNRVLSNCEIQDLYHSQFGYSTIEAGVNQSICAENPITLTASGGVTYTWDNNVINSQAFIPTTTQNYIVTGTDTLGCVGTDTVCITVLDPYSVKLPNIISPNGDALNQTWRIDMLPEFEKYEVTIMDRQGAVVMKKSPYDNSFNGSDSEGKELVNGVYFYYLRHTEQDIKFKGYIQVIR
jgi:gliding motility-associated-like protein